MSTSNAYVSDPTNVQDKTTTQQPGYMQQAYQGATNIASSAANAFQSAMGTSPTTQTAGYRNQQPHVGGVGDLGTSSEADIVRLPEERVNPEPYTGTESNSLSQANPALGKPIESQGQYGQRDTDRSFPQDDSSAGQTVFQDNRQGYIPAGVGDLGTDSAPDVARLPEERANPDPLASHPGASTGIAAGTTAGMTTGTEDGDHWRHHKSYNQAIGDPAHAGHSGGITGSNHDTDHGLGAPHREGVNEMGGRDAGAVSRKDEGMSSAYDDGRQFAQRDTENQYGQQPGGNIGEKDLGERQFTDRDAQDQSTDRPMDQELPGDNTDQTTGPSKIDQLKGRYHMAKGKLMRDPEEIEQGKRLKETGKYIDIEQELKDGRFDDVLDKKGVGQEGSSSQF